MTLLRNLCIASRFIQISFVFAGRRAWLSQDCGLACCFGSGFGCARLPMDSVQPGEARSVPYHGVGGQGRAQHVWLGTQQWRHLLRSRLLSSGVLMPHEAAKDHRKTWVCLEPWLAPGAVPILTEFLRLQLKAARCLGDMARVAESHAAVARSLRREQPMHVEVLAHWVGHLRAGGGDTDAFKEVQSLTRFWLGRSVGIAATRQMYEGVVSDGLFNLRRKGKIPRRNCGASVEVPNTTSQPASRSPSPFERYDSAASTYYQAGNTYLQQSFSSTSLGSNRSLSPHSRSLSPTPGGAMDLRIQSIRPANGGHIALSVATWGDSNPASPPPGAFSFARFHNMPAHMTHQLSRKTRSRSPETMRSRPSERNLPPLRDTSNPQHRMMGSASATELRRDNSHCGQA
eukprot:s5589_g1.t1